MEYVRCGSQMRRRLDRYKELRRDEFRTFIKYIVPICTMPRGMKKGLDTKKFDRCVSKVKGRSGKKANPYAVCNATMSGKSRAKSR